jgi:hypothetical protein
LLLLAGGAAFVVNWRGLSGILSGEETPPQAVQSEPLQVPRSIPAQSARLVYAYSVVPGGVADAEDVRRAVAADPVVGEHYRGLNFAHLVTASLSADTTAYVSFRKGDRVYWTTKKVRLSKGEAVLSDGINMVRARCGNRISDASKAGTTSQEPPEAELNTPLLPGGPMAPLQLPGPPEQARLLAAAIAPLLPEPPPPLPANPEEMISSDPKDGTLAPPEQDGPAGPYWYVFPSPGYFPGWGLEPVLSPAQQPKDPVDPVGSGDTARTSSETPLAAPAPEPSSWLLVGAGMLGLGGLLTRARRRSNR